MKSVRVALTSKKKKSLKSWLIQWRMGVNYSHACVITKDEQYDLYDVYQASYGQVHEVGLDVFKEENNLVKVFYLEMTEEQHHRGMMWLKKQRGRKYSFWGLIACTFQVLRKLKIGRDGDKEFICSEYAFRYLEVCFDVQLSKKADDYITPSDLENLLSRAEEFQALGRSGFLDAVHQRA